MGVGLKRFMKIASLVLAIVVAVLFLQAFVLVGSNKNYMKVRGFYQEPRDSLDVVLMGSSDIYTAFSSGQAYEEQGFTSYPLAVEANPSDLWMYSLKEIQRTQDPQLVVIEINGALYPGPVSVQGHVHDECLLDYAPLTLNKIKAVRGLDTDDPLPYFLPIIRYHGLWQDMDSLDDSAVGLAIGALPADETAAGDSPSGAAAGDSPSGDSPSGAAAGDSPSGDSGSLDSPDSGKKASEGDGSSSPFPHLSINKDYFTLWLRGYSVLKGNSTETTIAPLGGELVDKRADRSTQELEPLYEQQLNQVMDYCQQEEIPLLFVRSVHRVNTKDEKLYGYYQRANRAEEIIIQRGFPFLDLEQYDQEMGIDYRTDFYNNGHLNAAGQQKFTSFLSAYLVEECGVEPSALTGAQKKHWDKVARYTRLFQQHAIDLCNQGQRKYLSENYGLLSELKAMDQENSQ